MKQITQFLSHFSKNWAPALTVALISFPLSLSIAISSGVDPVTGLIAGAWAGLLGAVFMGTPLVIVGVAASIISIQTELIKQYNGIITGDSIITYISAVTIVAGVFLLVIRITNLQEYIKYIPTSIVTGFAAGIGLVIIRSQIGGLFGVESYTHLLSLDILSTAIGIGGLVFLLVLSKIFPKIPGPVVLSVIGICIGYFVIEQYGGSVPLLQDKFVDLSPKLFQIPKFQTIKWENTQLLIDIILSGLLIAIVIVLESLITSRFVSQSQNIKKSFAKRDIVGLGIINIILGCIGAMPVLSLISRTSAGLQNKASHISYLIMYGIIMGLMLLFLTPLIGFYPFPIIAAILIFVALPLINIKEYIHLWYTQKRNFSIAIIVALLVLISNATIAVLVGALISLLIIIHDQAQGYYYVKVNKQSEIIQTIRDNKELPQLPNGDLLVYGIEGPLMYYNIREHIQRIQTLQSYSTPIIVTLKHVYMSDEESIAILLDTIHDLHEEGVDIFLSSINPTIQHLFDVHTRFETLVKDKFVYKGLTEALRGSAYLVQK